MNTTQNRAAVHAQFLRAALADVKRSQSLLCREPMEVFAEALASIAQVAEELETIAAQPDQERTHAQRLGLDEASRAADPL